MFNGPYFITEVTHTITKGDFKTAFRGTRQGIYDMPAIENYLQSINQNLLTKIEEIVKNSKDSVTDKPITDIDTSKYLTQSGNNAAAAQNSCSSNLRGPYVYWGNAQPATQTTLSPQQFADKVKAATPIPELQVLIYILCYINTYDTYNFIGYNNNFGGIALDQDWGTGTGFMLPQQYSCVEVPNLTPIKKPQPIANFETAEKFLDFMVSRLNTQYERVFNPNMGVPKFYVCNWPIINQISEDYYNQNQQQYVQLKHTIDKALKSAQEVGLNRTSITTAKEVDAAQQANIANTNAGVTPNPNNLNTSTTVVVTCPPPKINSFTPLTGVTGTILSINGNYLDEITGVTINGVFTTTGITIINTTNITVIVPFSNTPIPQTNTIILHGIHGDSVSLGNFTYNPNQQTPTSPPPIPGAPPNVNTQPQQTGPTPLTGKTTTNLIGSDETLIVGVNPDAGSWNILSEFNNWQYKVVRRTLGPNNTIVEEILAEDTVQQEFRSNVSTNKQKFFLSDFDLIQGLKANSGLTDKQLSTASYIYNKFEFVASSPDKFTKFNITNNSKDVIPDAYQSFAMTLRFP